MEQFLKSVERRAFRMAQIATGTRDDALDVLQDAMLEFVRAYAHKPMDEWKPLFYRIVQNKIRDWRRAFQSQEYLRGLPSRPAPRPGPEGVRSNRGHKGPRSRRTLIVAPRLRRLSDGWKPS